MLSQKIYKVRQHQLWGRVNWVVRSAFFILFGLVILLVIGTVIYWAILPNQSPEWTGFGEYVSPQGEVTRAKTLWDWMDLLIVTAVIAVGVFLLNQSARRSEREIAAKNREADKNLERDRQKQASLEAYFDRMTKLLLDKDNPLRSSEGGDECRVMARTLTLITLRELDSMRIGPVFRFLREAGLTEIASLNGGDFSHCDWRNADLEGVDLRNADLRETNLSETNLSEANLSGADLSGADLSYANLYGARLIGTKINSETNLTGTYLVDADLIDISWDGINLSGITLVLSNLSRAYLREVNLSEADMMEAELIKANLSRANLSGADLNEANLSEANLNGANLSGANLSGANLMGADLSEAIISGIKYNEYTIWPDNFSLNDLKLSK